MSERRVFVEVNDLLQKGYVYFLTEPVGRNFDPSFKPELTPKEMLELGVFGGRYMTDCKKALVGRACLNCCRILI